MTTLIDGKSIAAKMTTELAKKVAGMNIQPGLAVILVGDDPASHVYVSHKIKACTKVGIRSFESRLPARATQSEIAAEIKAFNDNKNVHGILLQLPVPKHLDSEALVQLIAPHKDVDGLTIANAGKLFLGHKNGLVPCTPQGSLILIKSVIENLSGLHAVVIGRSNLFGKPMAQLLLQENCTVTMAHSRTKNLPEICRSADILIAAVGQPNMVKGDWIKKDACVIDVGINRLNDGKLCGDVDFAAAQGIAEFITPVPGGVGPMTIACLLGNTVRACESSSSFR
jgi:methylenetetrahydrofolate dehydrogenase (NADP+)/methenyltetrahydrofolate cyclohydrolase